MGCLWSTQDVIHFESTLESVDFARVEIHFVSSLGWDEFVKHKLHFVCSQSCEELSQRMSTLAEQRDWSSRVEAHFEAMLAWDVIGQYMFRYF